MIEEVLYRYQKRTPRTYSGGYAANGRLSKTSKPTKAKKRIRTVSLVSASLFIFSLAGAILWFGFYPVRDTLLGYPTKKLENNSWITSMYGIPPIRMSTPRVLKRVESIDENVFKQFVLGTPDDAFFITLKFSEKSKKDQNSDVPSTPNVATADEVQAITDATIQNYQSLGASNILINSEVMETASGIPALKIFGTLDYPRKGASKKNSE